MKKFTDFLLKVYDENLSKVIVLNKDNEAIENYTITDLKDYTRGDIREDTNVCFKYLDSFFEKIPSEIWEKVAQQILSEFDVLMRQEDTKIYNKDTSHLRTKKGSVLKKDDIKALEKVIPILYKFFDIRLGNTQLKKIEDFPNDIEIPEQYYNGILSIETILTLIQDIKDRKYDQGFYFEQRGAKKEDLKNYLLQLNKTYNAKRSKDIHNFIKYFKPEQYSKYL